MAPHWHALRARACGDWSRTLHAFTLTPDFGDVLEDLADEEEHDLEAISARSQSPRRRKQKKESPPGRSAYLILWGPFGGPTPRAGDSERVLLFAGGSGATFHAGGAGRGGTTNWFAPYLLQIATLVVRPDSGIDLRTRIFVTCLCDPPPCRASPGAPSPGAPQRRAGRRGALAPVREGRRYEGLEHRGVDGGAAAEVEVDLEMGRVDVGANESESGWGRVAVFAAGPGGGGMR
ncbi:hypothetical protein B0H13DRAFT_1936663, partial [Mycena leptocephala]